MTVIIDHNTRASLGNLMTFYKIDLSYYKQPDIFMYKGSRGQAPISFGGQLYDSWPIETKGFGVAGKGRLPTPTFAIGDHDATLSNYVSAHNDFRGAKITRLETYKRFIDGQPDADATQTQPKEVWLVVKKESNPIDVVQFKLESLIANRGRQFPARTAAKNYCPWNYRTWNGESFDDPTGFAVCPYKGEAYFDADDNPVTDPADDACSKRGSGCDLRYGNEPQPFGGFKGIGRLR